MIIIPDLDFYLDTMNFYAFKDAGASGAIVRAGQRYWKDSRATVFMRGALDVGLPIGSYWFFDSRESPKNQAQYWSEVLDGFPTKLFCWADFEDSYDGKYSGWTALYDFLEYSKQLMPERKFGIYTGYYYWREHGPSPLYFPAQLAYFGQYPLWMPWYARDFSDVKIPAPWTNPVLWQYSESANGRRYGAGAQAIDLNQFLGTDEKFRTYFDVGTPQGEPMPDSTVTYEGKITWAEGVNLRKEPYVNNLTNPVLRTLAKDTSFVATDYRVITPGVEEWLKIEDGWFVSVYGGNKKCDYVVVTHIGNNSKVIKIVVTLDDGTIWEATTFTEVK